MKWKRKGGCLRAQDAEFQARIEGPGDEGTVFLSFKGADGSWWEPRAMPNIEAARRCAEELREVFANVTTRNAELLAKRREFAAKEAALSPDEKAIRNLWRIYQSWSPFERATARRVRPDMTGILDTFDKIMAEDAKVSP